jgi:hypothetical protein
MYKERKKLNSQTQSNPIDKWEKQTGQFSEEIQMLINT